MIDANKFNSEISDFRHGTLKYVYNFNSAGNLSFKENSEAFSENFLKIPIVNSEYDIDRLKKFYNLSFEEFRTTEPDRALSKQVSVTSLESQINELRSQISSSSSVNVDDNYKLRSQLKAFRDTIIELRISSGEGKSADDFFEEFPFYPKKDKTISTK